MRKATRAALVVLALSGATCLGDNGEITGVCREYLTGKPLPRVAIVVKVSNQAMKDHAGLTDKDGGFRVADLPFGKVRLEFWPTGAQRGQPLDATLTASAPKVTRDVEITPDDVAYFSRVIEAMRGATAPAVPFADVWAHMKGSLSSEGAVNAAKAITAGAPELANQVPEIKSFASANSSQVTELQEALRDQVVRPEEVPSLAKLNADNLPKSVVGDVVAKDASARFHKADERATLGERIEATWGKEYSNAFRESARQVDMARSGQSVAIDK